MLRTPTGWSGFPSGSPRSRAMRSPISLARAWQPPAAGIDPETRALDILVIDARAYSAKPVVLWSSTRFPLSPQNPTSAR